MLQEERRTGVKFAIINGVDGTVFFDSLEFLDQSLMVNSWILDVTLNDERLCHGHSLEIFFHCHTANPRPRGERRFKAIRGAMDLYIVLSRYFPVPGIHFVGVKQ